MDKYTLKSNSNRVTNHKKRISYEISLIEGLNMALNYHRRILKNLRSLKK